MARGPTSAARRRRRAVRQRCSGCDEGAGSGDEAARAGGGMVGKVLPRICGGGGPRKPRRRRARSNLHWHEAHSPVQAEPVEALPSYLQRQQEREGFDKLSPNGDGPSAPSCAGMMASTWSCFAGSNHPQKEKAPAVSGRGLGQSAGGGADCRGGYCAKRSNPEGVPGTAEKVELFRSSGRSRFSPPCKQGGKRRLRSGSWR